MKPHFVVLCIAFASSTFCFSQSPSEEDLCKKLSKGDAKSLETVLKAPDEYSAIVLYVGALAAFKNKNLEDGEFLFYAGQLRARFDRLCFPPTETGGNSPFVLYAAISQGLGSRINPAVMAEPQTFARAIERLEKWTPKASKEYTPGYEFKERLSEKDAHEAAKSIRTEFLSRMGDFSQLLNDAEYFAAFRVMQAYNLSNDDKRPTEEEYEEATATMKRIEKDKGLKGIFSK